MIKVLLNNKKLQIFKATMLAFFYFLQMLINLPKMLVLSWNNMATVPTKSTGSLRITTISEKLPELWQTPKDVLQGERLVNISLCHVAARQADNDNKMSFLWKLYNEKTELLERRSGASCSQVFSLDPKYTHKITVQLTMASSDMEDAEYYTEIIEKSSKIDKVYWLASVGDSFSSGQGNPDIPVTRGKAAKWLDETCYRSSKSFPYQVFRKMTNKSSALSFFACSGATVDAGILSKNGQLDRLEKVMKLRDDPPDVLLLTIGGNDIGFTDIISMMQQGSSLEQSFDMRFFYVSHQIDRVATKIQELKIPRVILITYYDVTKNEHGVVDASCGLFGQVSLSNLQQAEKKILRRLNQLLIKKAKKYGWITVDTTEMFRRNGLCSNHGSLIRSRNESLTLQGNEYGSFHPNEEAHRKISEMVLKVLENV
uniref:SGNH_hydro domain-containing protein n=1 Tax=Caenorhabditis japonica TaxID=281687 RepID=A0A8R1DH30_CAEJA